MRGAKRSSSSIASVSDKPPRVELIAVARFLAAAGLIVGLIVGLIAALVPAEAQDLPVLRTNYDIKLSVDGGQYRVGSRALVRSGHEIPAPLQDFKIGLRIFEEAPDDFRVRIVLYEKDGRDWHPITGPPPEFVGKIGTPTQYVWESGGMKLDVAIVVGRYAGVEAAQR